jgi:hypothetical protein
MNKNEWTKIDEIKFSFTLTVLRILKFFHLI